MAGSNDTMDRILDKLVRDVEHAVHALYRGDVRQQTAKAKTDGHRVTARKALLDLLEAAALNASPAGALGGPGNGGRGGTATRGPAPSNPSFAPGPVGAASYGIGPSTSGGGPLSSEEGSALMKCIMAWLPMGPPTGAAPDARCVPAGKELIPSWGEREMARQAARRVSPKT
ncbi:MAG TPA: hypothetical protein VMM18_05425 [Gemmatimonadaceae bacterium]|nr:hypothetical protein [Gemmatimonadaceae bacterium]